MPFTGRVRLITAGTALVGPADFSEWSVVDENGTAIPGTLFRYSDDGKSVYLSRPLGIVIRLF